MQDRVDLPIVNTSQEYSPFSASVTLNKINDSLLGTQTALKCMAKTGSTCSNTFCTKVTAGWSRNFINTAAMLESAVKLKLQLSSSFRDPWITCLMVLEILDGSVTVSNGGGSSQVMLPPTKRETLIERRFCHDDLN